MSKAKPEACALFIEQEIESGIEQGKPVETIGKEISKWVAKLFEIKIKPRAIAQKARRTKKTVTNVTSDINSGKQIENTKSNKSNRGGARPGAGRKPNIKDRIAAANTMKINDQCGFDRDIFYAQPENKARSAYAAIDCGLSSITEAFKKIDDTDCLLSFIDMTFCNRWDFVFQKIESLVTKHKEKQKGR